MVIPITMPVVDWQRLITETTNRLGRSPSRDIDAARIPLKTPTGYLRFLALFKDPTVDLRQILKDPNWNCLYDHYTFGVLIFAEPDCLMDLMLRSTVSHLWAKEHTASILTGNLRAWRESIGNFCRFDDDVNEIGNMCYALLEQAGFSDLFVGFDKKPVSDGRFILVAK